MLLRLLLLLISIPAGATVFKPMSVEKQITEADGVITGHFLRSKSVKLDDGSIATQMIFKMNKEFGMQSDVFRMDEIIVHYPGGTFEDKTVRVEGTPEFIPGESVALLIKSREDRYWGLNLGMGSFKIINYGKETLVVNSIFPQDRRMSQIKLEDFEKTVRLIKKSNLKTVYTPSYQSEEASEISRLPASQTEGQIRSIASRTDKEENSKEGPIVNNFWLILLLAVMGGLFRLTRQREAK